MIALRLNKPFNLAFGSLLDLPRVILILEAKHNNSIETGVGEASIDFPFSHYDAWDIYKALDNIDFTNVDISQRELILKGDSNPEIRSELIKFPSALCAFNMAIDDLYGKIYDLNIADLYGRKRSTGKILQSISSSNIHSLVNAAREIYHKERLPKIKLGMGITKDVEKIKAINNIFPGNSFAVDFNAAYNPAELAKFISFSKHYINNNIIFFEQPTQENLGISGLIEAKKLLTSCVTNPVIVADESFVSKKDGLECNKNGIHLNYKIQKIGGIFEARSIEQSLPNKLTSFIGGTFPTAIGRAYDQLAGCVLETTSLPSDGWQPSSDWFNKGQHIIKEVFEINPMNEAVAFKKDGLGATPDWEKIQKLIIADPLKEYQAIRNNRPANKIEIILKDRLSYKLTYESLTGKKIDWNLR